MSCRPETALACVLAKALDDDDVTPDLRAACLSLAAAETEVTFATFEDLQEFGADMVQVIKDPTLRLAARKLVKYANEHRKTKHAVCTLEGAGTFTLDAAFEDDGVNATRLVANALVADLHIPLESETPQAAFEWNTTQGPHSIMDAFEDLLHEGSKDFSVPFKLREFRVLPVHAKPVCIAIREKTKVVLVCRRSDAVDEVVLAEITKKAPEDRVRLCVVPQPSDAFVDALKTKVCIKSWTATDPWNPCVGWLEFFQKDNAQCAKVILTRAGHRVEFAY